MIFAVVGLASLLLVTAASAGITDKEFIALFSDRIAVVKDIESDIARGGMPSDRNLRRLVAADRSAQRRLASADIGGGLVNEAAQEAVMTTLEGEARWTERLLAGQITVQAWAQEEIDARARLEQEFARLAGIAREEESQNGGGGFDIPYPLDRWWFWLLGPGEVILGIAALPLIWLTGGAMALGEWWRERREW